MNEKQHRPDWTEYFLDIAKAVGRRATCLRRRYGAIIVKDKIIISTGYNGAPAGVKTCQERGECMRRIWHIQSGTRQEFCYAIHAEQNAIIQAAHLGQSIAGGTLYCTNQPCVICAKMIINSGIRRIVYKHGYPDEFALKLLHEAGVEVVVFREE